MAKAQRQAPSLSGEQLGELLGLIKGADTVELKLTVPESDHRSAAASLDLDALDAQIRQVVFFDTPDLTLNQNGLVVRARRVQGKGDDSVVKLRPVVPDELPCTAAQVEAVRRRGRRHAGWIRAARRRSKRNGDRMPCEGCWRETARSASCSRRSNGTSSPPTHRKGIALDDLVPLGPINVLKLKFVPKTFPRPMVAELWFYPNGSRILELSTKCAPAEAFQVSAESRAFLAERGVDLSGQPADQDADGTRVLFKASRAKRGFLNPRHLPRSPMLLEAFGFGPDRTVVAVPAGLAVCWITVPTR